MLIQEQLQKTEELYQILEAHPSDATSAKLAFEALLALIKSICRLPDKSGTPLSELLTIAIDIGDRRREVAIFMARASAIPQIRTITEDIGGGGVERKACALFEAGLPDLRGFIGYDEKKLTHEKLSCIAELHSKVIEALELFCDLPSNPNELISRRQDVFKRAGYSLLKTYLNPYGYADFNNTVREVINAIAELLETNDSSFSHKLPATATLIDNAVARWNGRVDFLASVARRFLKSCQNAVIEIERASTERFKCALTPRRQSPYVLERRYPFNDADRVVRIKVPVINSGPGIASDCRAQIVCSSEQVAIGGDQIDIGAIPPGEFALSFEVLLGIPVKELSFWIELSWNNVKGTEPQQTDFEALALGQDPNIDWINLDHSDPYSTDVAHGQEFVGRTKKVSALAGRLIKEKMQSSYITGQKRVGKTSLTFAVQDRLKEIVKLPEQIEFIYLEYGEYARADAAATVRALGEAISLRLFRNLPDGMRIAMPDFMGTLAPLNQIAQQLEDFKPALKNIIVLDEFDEIHPEMYRFGPLAEAFFSNLRTLSAKKNIGMLLVGGENMPFIIGAQGDQLNKFIREPLDYFSRTEEWDDFKELVRQEKQQKPALNWHDAAITEIFNVTNGQPHGVKGGTI